MVETAKTIRKQHKRAKANAALLKAVDAQVAAAERLTDALYALFKPWARPARRRA